MLGESEIPAAKGTGLPCIPDEILDAVRRGDSSRPSTLGSYLIKAGRGKYVCQAFPLTSTEPFPRALVVLLLHRSSSTTEAIEEVAADFRLTEREREALHGICLGLSSKDLAEQMNIRPSTVKAFLRIIMVKMGVTTRAAVVAKILERHAGLSGSAPASADPARRAASTRA